MNCVELVCGTGGWTGPRPGDPDSNNVSLSATPGFGGVNVSWTYPNVNPFAVAYTIVYRGSSSSFSTAIEIAKVAGNRYLDPMELHDNGLYYYWIRIMSVHGTEGGLVGPAECRMRTTIGQIIEDLTGEIREGVLHQSLLEKIERIQMLGDGLRGESLAREEDILAVSQTIEGLQVAVDSATAAISTETLVRISTIDALARELTTLSVEFEGRTGQLQQEIGLLITQDEALARAVTVAQVAADDANAAFRSEQSARISADSALASQIGTVESQMGTNLAQARQTLQTEINTVNGKVTAIGARYTVQVQVNGLAGGFGIYNNGSEIDAGFIADRFWVGNASTKRKPFIISGGVVYIDQAMIQDASITNAKIANASISKAKISNFDAEVANIANANIANIKIGTAQIQDASITTLKVGLEQITAARAASGSYQASVWIDGSGGFPITIHASVNTIPMTNETGGGIITPIINIYRGGSLILRQHGFSTFCSDTPWGGVTYSVTLDYPTWLAGYGVTVNIMALACKR